VGYSLRHKVKTHERKTTENHATGSIDDRPMAPLACGLCRRGRCVWKRWAAFDSDAPRAEVECRSGVLVVKRTSGTGGQAGRVGDHLAAQKRRASGVPGFASKFHLQRRNTIRVQRIITPRRLLSPAQRARQWTNCVSLMGARPRRNGVHPRLGIARRCTDGRCLTSGVPYPDHRGCSYDGASAMQIVPATAL